MKYTIYKKTHPILQGHDFVGICWSQNMTPIIVTHIHLINSFSSQYHPPHSCFSPVFNHLESNKASDKAAAKRGSAAPMLIDSLSSHIIRIHQTMNHQYNVPSLLWNLEHNLALYTLASRRRNKSRQEIIYDGCMCSSIFSPWPFHTKTTSHT